MPDRVRFGSESARKGFPQRHLQILEEHAAIRRTSGKASPFVASTTIAPAADCKNDKESQWVAGVGAKRDGFESKEEFSGA